MSKLIVEITAIHPLTGDYQSAVTQFNPVPSCYPSDFIEVSFLRDIKGNRAIKRGNMKLNGVTNGVMS